MTESGELKAQQVCQSGLLGGGGSQDFRSHLEPRGWGEGLVGAGQGVTEEP